MRTGLVAAGVAATVAGLAVISLNNLDNEPGSVARQAVAQTGSVMDSRMAISPGRLTSYLVSHGEYASSLSRPVMDSHIVSPTAVPAVWEISGDSVYE